MEKSCGSVIYINGTTPKYLIIRCNKNGLWGFPKGHVIDGEDEIQTAIRKVREETGIIISLLMEYDLFKKIKEIGWLDEFTKELENSIIKTISDTIYPMLKDNIVTRFSFSPLSIENRIASSEGSIVGWSFEKPIPVINKIQFSAKSVKTPFPSIYQAGQWAYSPGGVPMSILTGKLAADKVIKNSEDKSQIFLKNIKLSFLLVIIIICQ